MDGDLELRELVKRLLNNYVSFHRIRRLDRVGFTIFTPEGVEIGHFVDDDQQAIFERLRELTSES